MRTLKKTSLGTLCTLLAFVLVGLIAGPSVTEGDKPAPVEVTNVPLPVTGTVGATESGAWSVGIDSANNTVLIGNPATNPLLVRDVDNPALQPWQSSQSFSFSYGVGGVDLGAGIPIGKQLVIEFVSADFNVPSGTTPLRLQIDVYQGGLPIPDFFSPKLTSSSLNEYVVSQPTRLYHEAGNSLLATVYLDSQTNGGNGQITLSGYLVDLPASQ